MDAYVWDGAQRRARSVYAHDGSTWQDCKKVYVHDGSEWRQAFDKSFTVTVQAVDYSIGTYPLVSRDSSGTCSVTLNPNGTGQVDSSSTPGGPDNEPLSYARAWGTPEISGAGASYHARLRKIGGSDPSGLSANVWYSLGSARTWTWTTTSGDIACQFFIDISPDFGNSFVSSIYSGISVSWVND